MYDFLLKFVPALSSLLAGIKLTERVGMFGLEMALDEASIRSTVARLAAVVLGDATERTEHRRLRDDDTSLGCFLRRGDKHPESFLA